MEKCIICNLKTGHTESYLITVCPWCVPRTTKQGKYKREDALVDDKNVCRSITSTLRPKFQMFDPDTIVKLFSEKLKDIIRTSDIPAYIECTFEFTSNGVIHMHGYCCCRQRLFSKITSYLRRYGYVKTVDIFDLREWITYMYKDQCDDSYKPICVSS